MKNKSLCFLCTILCLFTMPFLLAQSADNQGEITITAVGDIMIGSSFPSEQYLPKDDAKNSFSQVLPYLKGDVVFGNLEGVLLDKGNSTKCAGKKQGTCYAFRMPERYGKIIKQAGFNLMSVANNHAGDFGDIGRKRTLQVLDEVGIRYAGQVEKPYDIFEINGIKYGFCAFSPNRNMVSVNDVPKALSIVKKLREQVQILIVSFHAGAEGAQNRHVPKKNEYFYGENRGDVHAFAHQMIDAGADIVLGHGPHITRAVEVYKNKFIAYSLGNFNTYGQFSLTGPNGVAPLLQIRLTTSGDFVQANVVSIKQTKERGLEIDPSGKAFQHIRELTNADFPNHGLLFGVNTISKKNN